MTVLITLTVASIDSGPFNLYSNLDGYTTPFETNVDKTVLQFGYSSALVPDYTTTIRCKSVGICINYIDIPVGDYVTTSTTTTVPVVLTGAKFIIFTYKFTAADGTDLDTSTGLVVPPIVQLINPIGWCAGSGSLPSGFNGGPYLFWGGDNTASGSESVYLDIDAIITDMAPTPVTDVKIICKSSWLGVLLNGMVSVELKAYSAGPITISPAYNFVGPIGDQIGSTFTFPPVHVTDINCTVPVCLGEFNYNLITGVLTRVYPC